jgi:hypothetical protein
MSIFGNYDITNHTSVLTNSDIIADQLSTDYYDKTETNALLVNKSDTTHSHTVFNGLSMNNNKITDLLAGTLSTDAVTKAQLDGIDLTLYVKKDGTTLMTGNLDMNLHTINNVLNPVLGNDVINKNYLDFMLQYYILKNNGSLSSNLNANFFKLTNLNPGILDNDSVNKSQMDSSITNAVIPYLLKAGGTMTGHINMNQLEIQNISALYNTTCNVVIKSVNGCFVYI